MPHGGTRTSLTALAAIVAVLLLAVPSTASAARGPGSATITSCGSDRLTVTGRVAVTGKAARKARRATLEVRFHAMPLFGLPRIEAWRSLGRKLRASAQHEFTGLAADVWAGVMSWRYKRGRRTVLSGIERSQPLRIGRSRGRATCVVSEGLKPVDSVPPTLYILPSDGVWHRAPTPVQLLAQDDFSGVQSVRYSVDGGPITEIRNGASFEIPNERAHTVQWAATDVAGNTGTRSEIVRVDAAPPSKPVLSRPFGVTASTTPTFTWSASTDSGSGLKGYFLAIKRADGSLVALRPFDANTTSAPSPATLNPGETYTATVTAIDNTDDPWAIESDALTFRVDPDPGASASPTSGTVLSGGLKDTSFTITLDRNADPNTVSASTVILDRHLESGADPGYTVSCSSPCSTITVDPTGTLGEGRYVLSLSGVKSEEGVDFPNPSARYSVPFHEAADRANVGTSGVCALDYTDPQNHTVNTTDPAERGTFSFDWAFSGSTSWRVRALDGGTELDSVTGGPGSGRETLEFAMPDGDLTIEFFVDCASGSAGILDTANLVGARTP